MTLKSGRTVAPWNIQTRMLNRKNTIARQRLQKAGFSIVSGNLEFLKARRGGVVIRESYFIKNDIGPQMMDSAILYFDKGGRRSYYEPISAKSLQQIPAYLRYY